MTSCDGSTKRPARHARLPTGLYAAGAYVRGELFAGSLVGTAVLDDGRRFGAVAFKADLAQKCTDHHQSCTGGRRRPSGLRR
jgi:hypothetical protein